MALGTYSNKSSQKKNYSPETYSQVRFFNPDSKVDPSAMSFSYWRGLMKISLSPIKVAQGSSPEIDRDNVTEIYLSPIKALLFLLYVEAFKKDPSLYANSGVTTNKGIIYITNGKSEFNMTEDTAFIVVKLVDESGNVTSSIAYEFGKSGYFGITDYNGGTNFQKNYDYADTIELDMFIKTLASYVSSANNAIAGSVAEAMHYDINSIKSKLTSIQESLGIETNKSYGNAPKSNASSFWNNNGSSSSSLNNNNVQGSDYENYNELIDDLSDVG